MKKYRIKIWDSELTCPICKQDIFGYKEVKIVDHKTPYENEIRYFFECEKCGHGMFFGAVTEWEPEERLNFQLSEVNEL